MQNGHFYENGSIKVHIFAWTNLGGLNLAARTQKTRVVFVGKQHQPVLTPPLAKTDHGSVFAKGGVRKFPYENTPGFLGSFDQVILPRVSPCKKSHFY